MVFLTAFHKVSSHQTRDLEFFADSSSIPWNPLTIFRPDLIATVPQRPSFTLRTALSAILLVSDLCVFDEAMIPSRDLHNICQIACEWSV